MAIISYPQSGQPIDVSYISNIVAAVNQLSEEITPSSTKYVNVDTSTAGKQSVSVSEYLLRIQNCEWGRMFISRSGAFTAQPRVQPEVTNPLATLSDTGTGIDYETFDIVNS